mmetsp:Transcript_54638/g.97512  ORF Transcript_54638/g.97512 Transcript_54638/m.97512 type:complete len:182 (-) Transcript_54638:88-633(-)
MAPVNVSRMLQVLPLMLALRAASGDAYDNELTINNQSAQLFLRGSSSNHTAARRLGKFSAPDWRGCSSMQDGKFGIAHTVIETVEFYPCLCVENIYVDKRKDCMCGEGSKKWCSTACDPHGDDPESSCCQPFKKLGETCGQDWECGPGHLDDEKEWLTPNVPACERQKCTEGTCQLMNKCP